MKYFRLVDDMWEETSQDRWIFGRFKYETERANYEFIDPPIEYMAPCTYPIELRREGKPTDFSFTMDPGNVPILSTKAKNALAGIPEVDRPYHDVVIEPICIENTKVVGTYFVMIIETQVACVDEARSRFEKYIKDDPVRPDKAGQYRYFYELVLDPTKTESRHIFRLKDHLSTIIVSEEVKLRFENAGVTGAKFESVS
ncbi:imm11 family protein [Paracoccus sp. (in: a-proteobacteria)]|uniref:imm11 family protein n=1 Tax=Paracoccus sp. TaxID=267 RepID=UPI00289FB887|nr:DUF1629 domain-containing protein [Paracoccus sp. (in: a-proteobacteria)]